jgi:hypothetical protein
MPNPTYVPLLGTAGNVSFGGNLVVTGTTTLSGLLTLNAAGVVITATSPALKVTGTANGQQLFVASGNDATSFAYRALVTADTFDRFAMTVDGAMAWGSGAIARDTTLSRSGVNALNTPGFFAMGSGQSGGAFTVFGNSATSLSLGSAGGGLAVKEGANARMGVSTLVGGTVTVANTSVTATTRIQLTTQTLGGTIGVQYISARVVGTSFTITSSSVVDTSTVAWFMTEPA